MGAPEQVVPALVKRGVTIIVATTGLVPEFTAANDAIFPLPLAAKPIPGLSFVQSKTVLEITGDVKKVIALVFEPLQRI